MRLFTGLFLPPEITADLRHHIDSFQVHPDQQRGSNSQIRWVSDSSLHITLKFIGETKEENVSIFKSVLDRLAANHKAFTLHCEGGGVYPNEKTPRVLWTGIKGDVGPLNALAGDSEEEFGQMGFPPENRKFSPHITLARIGRGTEGIKNFEKHFSTYRSPRFNIHMIHLIQSRLNAMGSQYQILSSHELGQNP